MRCFAGVGWCGSDSRLQILNLVLALLFTLVILLRSYCYTPFYDCLNPLAMYPLTHPGTAAE